MNTNCNDEMIFGRFEHYFEIPYTYRGEFRLELKHKLNEYLIFFKNEIVPNFFDGILLLGLDDNGEPDFSKGDDNNNGEYFTSQIEKLNDTIIEAIELHYLGYLHKSYDHLYKVLKEQWIYDKLHVMNYMPSKLLFRLREIGKTEEFENKGSIFHIPFDLRGKVAQQRYSINGFPSLYLGEDVHICCKELGLELKHKNKYIGSAFELKNLIKVFQFLRIEQFNQAYIKDYGGSLKDDKIRNYLLTFPLIIASSFRVRNAKDYFKPEYIIP